MSDNEQRVNTRAAGKGRGKREGGGGGVGVGGGEDYVPWIKPC